METRSNGALWLVGIAVALAALGAWRLLSEEPQETETVAAPARDALPAAPAAGPAEPVPPSAPDDAQEAAPRAEVPAAGEDSAARTTGIDDARPAGRTVLAVRVVLDETGEGVAGVRVEVSFADREPAHGTTDERGVCEIELEDLATTSTVTARAGPKSTGVHEYERRRISAGEREELELTVERGATVRGRVIDVEGRGVPGARVRGWCAPRHRVDGREGADPDREIVADASGAFELPHLGVDFVIDATAPGRACVRRLHGELRSGETVEGLEVVLDGAWTVEGRVRRESGGPVSGAEVSFGQGWISGTPESVTGVPNVYRTSPRSRTATSDANGAFRLEGLARWTYPVAVDAEEHPPWNGRHGPDDGFLEVVLEDGLVLHGVVRGRDGSGLGGARVRVRGSGFGPGDRVRGESVTEESGAFEVLGLAPDPDARLYVDAPDHAVHVQQPVRLADDAPPVEVRLGPPWRLAGRVVDLDGRPVADAEVTLEGDRIVDFGNVTMHPTPTWEWVHGLSRAWTGAQGHFEFDRLYEGTFQVTATDPDDGTLRARTSARSGSEELRLVLDPATARGVALVGRVTDARTGEPIEEFTVTPMVRDPGSGGASGRGRSFEDPDGKFEIVGLEPAEIGLWVRAPGYSRWKSPSRRYERGDHAFDVRLAEKRTLLLRCVDADGVPLAHGRVSFADARGEPVWIESGLGSTTSQLSLDEGGEGRAGGLPGAWLSLKLEHGHPARSQTFEIDLTVPTEGRQVFAADWRLADPADRVELRIAVMDARPDSPEADRIHGAALESYGEMLRAELGEGPELDPAALLGATRVDVAVRERATGAELARAYMERTEDGWSTTSSSGTQLATSVPSPELRLEIPRRPCTLEVTAPGRSPLAFDLSLEDLEDEPPWLILLRP